MPQQTPPYPLSKPAINETLRGQSGVWTRAGQSKRHEHGASRLLALQSALPAFGLIATRTRQTHRLRTDAGGMVRRDGSFAVKESSSGQQSVNGSSLPMRPAWRRPPGRARAGERSDRSGRNRAASVAPSTPVLRVPCRQLSALPKEAERTHEGNILRVISGAYRPPSTARPTSGEAARSAARGSKPDQLLWRATS